MLSPSLAEAPMEGGVRADFDLLEGFPEGSPGAVGATISTVQRASILMQYLALCTINDLLYSIRVRYSAY